MKLKTQKTNQSRFFAGLSLISVLTISLQLACGRPGLAPLGGPAFEPKSPVFPHEVPEAEDNYFERPLTPEEQAFEDELINSLFPELPPESRPELLPSGQVPNFEEDDEALEEVPTNEGENQTGEAPSEEPETPPVTLPDSESRPDATPTPPVTLPDSEARPETTPTPQPSPRPKTTPKPTPTPPKATPTPKPTPKPRPPATPPPLPTATPRPQVTPKPTATPKPAPTARPQQTPLPTATPQVTPTPKPTPKPDLATQVHAFWDKRTSYAKKWTQYTLNALDKYGKELLATTPRDVMDFCPAFPSLNLNGRKSFWVKLISAIAAAESSFNPLVQFKESFVDRSGKNVVSRGLLQISLESSNAYGCGIENEDQLHSPRRNLECGVRILNHWVPKDGVISGRSSNSKHLGGARYWAVLRLNTAKLERIQKLVSNTSLCKLPSK